MKTFIVSLALVILFNIYTVFQIDMDVYKMQLERLKHVAEECADSAALFYDTEQFSYGKKIIISMKGKRLFCTCSNHCYIVIMALNPQPVIGKIKYFMMFTL
jgi:hypothetical protein